MRLTLSPHSKSVKSVPSSVPGQAVSGSLWLPPAVQRHAKCGLCVCGSLSLHVMNWLDREQIDGHGGGVVIVLYTVKHGTPTLIWAPTQLTGTHDIIHSA